MVAAVSAARLSSSTVVTPGYSPLITFSVIAGWNQSVGLGLITISVKQGVQYTRPAYPKFPSCVLQWPKLWTFPQNGVLSKLFAHMGNGYYWLWPNAHTHLEMLKTEPKYIFFKFISIRTTMLHHARTNIFYLLYWVLIFNKMRIPCNGHVCFLLNNVRCCGRHIHVHNQFLDHRFSPRAPISEYFKEVPGTPCYNF